LGCSRVADLAKIHDKIDEFSVGSQLALQHHGEYRSMKIVPLKLISFFVSMFVLSACMTEDAAQNTEEPADDVVPYAASAGKPCFYVGGSPGLSLRVGKTYTWWIHLNNSSAVTADSVEVSLLTEGAELLRVWTWSGKPCSILSKEDAFCKVMPLSDRTLEKVWVTFRVTGPVGSRGYFWTAATSTTQANDASCVPYQSRVYRPTFTP